VATRKSAAVKGAVMAQIEKSGRYDQYLLWPLLALKLRVETMPDDPIEKRVAVATEAAVRPPASKDKKCDHALMMWLHESAMREGLDAPRTWAPPMLRKTFKATLYTHQTAVFVKRTPKLMSDEDVLGFATDVSSPEFQVKGAKTVLKGSDALVEAKPHLRKPIVEIAGLMGLQHVKTRTRYGRAYPRPLEES